MPLGYHEEYHPDISYSEGAWVDGTRFDYTNTENATVSFSIEGEGLILYRTLAFNRGPMEVCIDGGCVIVDNYDVGVLYAQPVIFPNLGPGIHAVTIRNASTAYIDLDAVAVVSPLPLGYHDEDLPDIIYAPVAPWGAWVDGSRFNYTNIENDAKVRRATGGESV